MAEALTEAAASAVERWRSACVTILVRLWPAYLLASVLIFRGIGWALPDVYHGLSFQADENAAVFAVGRIGMPAFNPGWFAWGTALFYQVYLVERTLSLLHIVPYDNFWILVMGRAVVVMSAFGCITLVYLIGDLVFGEAAGRIGACLLAVMPGFVISSHYYKTDIPMTVWLLAALYTACRLVGDGRFKQVVALGFLAGYATSVKYSAATFIPAALVAIWLSAQRKQPRAWIAFAASAAFGFVVGEPRIFLNFADVVKAVTWVGHLNSTGIPYVVNRPAAWLDYPMHVMPYASTLPLLILIAVGLVWAAAHIERKQIPIWVFVIFYFVLMANDNTRLIRYTVPFLAVAVLIASSFIASASTQQIRRIVRPAALLCAAYAFVYSLSYVNVMTKVDPRVSAGQWIERNLPRSDTLPVIETHYSNLPDFRFMKFPKQDIAYSISDLRSARSPYFVLSEAGPRFFREAGARKSPRENEFLDFVEASYDVAARFENSQRLLGVDSKAGTHLSEDWIRPNTAITIYRRRASPRDRLNQLPK